MPDARTEIAKTWNIFSVGAEDPIHLRAIGPKGASVKLPTKNITFNAEVYPEISDRQAMFEQMAIRLNDAGYNIYMIFNQICKSFQGDEHNGLAVKDADIACRRYLLIDIDRVEATQPATDDEMEEITEVANAIEHNLDMHFGYDPITVFSGNGAHIYFPLANLPNDVDIKSLCQRILKNLALRFNTPRVEIDTTVFNAARITKVPGTIARKGVESEGREFQMAYLIE